MPFRNVARVEESSTSFLSGGGRMGERIRSFDWTANPLGSPQRWPIPLRTTLRIMLTTQHPMFIFWGPELRCFWNDAYGRSIGPEKDLVMLGAPGGDHWQEIWDIIGPQIRLVMDGQGSTWHENQLVPILRNGRHDDVYWTYGYSPIDDESAPCGVGGVLVLCTETTAQVLTQRRQAFLVSLDDALRPLADARRIIATANQALGQHLGVSRVGFGQVQKDEESIRLETDYTQGVAPLSHSVRLSAFGEPILARHRQGSSVVCDDVASAFPDQAPAFASLETRAFVSVPLVRAGRLTASLFVTHVDARAWPPEDVALIETVAARIADAVERRHAEQELRMSEARLQIALTAAGAGIFEWRADTGEAVWSEGHYRLLGLEPYSVQPSLELWRRHVHPEDLPRVEAAVERAIASGDRYAADYRLLGADGVERWIQGQGLIVGGSGAPVRLIGALVDITVRKRAERDLVDSQEALRVADRRKDEFLAVLSHELRNPLAPIRTAAQILGSANLQPQQLRWAQTVIQRQAKLMACLLDDLLDVARITQGKLELKKEPVLLGSVVDTAVESARPLLDGKSHQLTVSLPPRAVLLQVDPVRLAQVLSNLLTNAAKYTDAGGHIALVGEVTPGLVRLTVKDDGIGIAQDARLRIFDMFSQVDGGSARTEGGLGIGLALVRGLVKLHGGTVEASSAGPGRGSAFTVSLPNAEAPMVDGAQPAAAEGAAPTRRRILVADDNQDATDSLAMLLELDGHEVRVAYTGREALALAQAFQPEVVLLDIGMPELDGFAVAQQLRRAPWGADVFLVAMTGWGQDADRQRTREAGFDRHLTKPLDPDAVAALLAINPDRPPPPRVDG